MSDTTLVTGAPGGRAPRKGEVLAERYEIVEALASDALVLTYRGLDQESDAPILLRCTAPGLLGERDARGMVERMRPLVGGGGRVISPLRDVDREGTLVLTVEPWPRGTSLRAVLDARRAKGAGTLEPREVLPVVARLAAAIASIPEFFWHGDVRADRVWVDPDGLLLTGGFLLSALSGELVQSALEREPGLRHGLAPEVAEGLGGRASDRWGVAAIAWEALIGRGVDMRRVAPPPALGPVGVELVRVLDADPAARPPTLDALVSALADLARLPIPQVDRDSFHVAASTTTDETTQVAELEGSPTDPSRRTSSSYPTFGDPPTERLTRSTEAMIQSDERLPTDPGMSAVASRDTARHVALDADGNLPEAGDLDPRLVRAALAAEADPLASAELELLDTKTDPGAKLGPRDTMSDELDPRLVRAALGIALDAPKPDAPPKRRSAQITQELAPNDLEELRATAPAARAPKIASAKATAVGMPVVVPAVVAAPAAAPEPARPARRRPARDPEPVPLPTDIKPIPRPRAMDSGEIIAPGPVLFDASKPAPRAPAPPPQAPVLPAVAPAAPAAPRARPARRATSWTSYAIIAGAVVIAIAIVAAGFLYRASMQREQERQQRIEQRLRELQSTTP
ncbi:hypothetical protein [Sandaracinus amylolyticus]|uniref:Serine/threonine-protein kinase PknA n=1 Tax=Sandaracinus amylolyticus TaxID=927083 RepID=A0A0F6W241_9BACT|nr:hypothetical protein [Sandaracinus amylolyticus]AKF05455.1 Serine/threonine-protein kinase PknA [Sandaracinus amylolyticus]